MANEKVFYFCLYNHNTHIRNVKNKRMYKLEHSGGQLMDLLLEFGFGVSVHFHGCCN